MQGTGSIKFFSAMMFVALAVLLSSAGTAQAHPGHDTDTNTALYAGFVHPLTGLDHLLAMIAVGVLAVRLGGRALWLMPCSFLGGMLLGGVLATAHVPLLGMEYGIVASVLALGVFIAAARPLPVGAAAIAIASFALFHGYAHATEMTGQGSFASYAAGFLISTALLHSAGIAGGLAMTRWLDHRGLRWVGGAIAAAGVWLLIGVL